MAEEESKQNTTKQTTAKSKADTRHTGKSDTKKSTKGSRPDESQKESKTTSGQSSVTAKKGGTQEVALQPRIKALGSQKMTSALNSNVGLFGEEEIAQFRETFALYDRDGDGVISTNDLGTALRALGQCPTESELTEIIRKIDVDNSGTVDFPEFLNVLSKKTAPIEAKDVREAFMIFDSSNKGYINAEEMRYILTTLGEKLTNDDLDELFRDIDATATNGQINLEEFVALIANK